VGSWVIYPNPVPSLDNASTQTAELSSLCAGNTYIVTSRTCQTYISACTHCARVVVSQSASTVPCNTAMWTTHLLAAICSRDASRPESACFSTTAQQVRKWVVHMHSFPASCQPILPAVTQRNLTVFLTEICNGTTADDNGSLALLNGGTVKEG